jgi:hypothetical protein
MEPARRGRPDTEAAGLVAVTEGARCRVEHFDSRQLIYAWLDKHLSEK